MKLKYPFQSQFIKLHGSTFSSILPFIATASVSVFMDSIGMNAALPAIASEF